LHSRRKCFVKTESPNVYLGCMLQPLTFLFTKFRSHYPSIEGDVVERTEPCGICGAMSCEQVAESDYWDLERTRLVKCTTCESMQIDPKLPDAAVQTGCLALYRLQQSGETSASRKRGFFRAFRKGVALGFTLKLSRIDPVRVLEVGSGDGYFLKGIQYVFPKAKFTCLDIVDEILDATSTVHGFESLCTSVENVSIKPRQKFDLVIARDILEHVNEPRRVLENLADLLVPGGYLYFITPNGKQDGWQLFFRWKKHKVAGELLINHVNYFDPMSLRNKLEKLGFILKKYYIYDLKQFFRGGRLAVSRNPYG